MKKTRMLLYILAFTASQSLFAGDVKIEKYNQKYDLPGIARLPKGTCVEINNISECSFNKNTAVKWGVGFCENTQEELNNRVKSATPVLLINGVPVEKTLILGSQEFYQRKKYGLCYTWLVKLSEWRSGAVVSLDTYDQGKLLYKAIIRVSENGT